MGLRYHRIVVNRENLDDYAEGQEPKGLQVQIVDQREDIVFDQSLFERWMAFGTDAGNLFLVCADASMTFSKHGFAMRRTASPMRRTASPFATRIIE